ncbi:MAG TPA: hypothetical protein PK228_13720 [Saprospiraceae bacterium]|nr:hypothetical protein [Saprospiraceae bacterium]
MSGYLSQIAARVEGTAASNALSPGSAAPSANAAPDQGIGEVWGPGLVESAIAGTLPPVMPATPVGSLPDPERLFRPATREPANPDIPYFSRYVARSVVPDAAPEVSRPSGKNPPEIEFRNAVETPETSKSTGIILPEIELRSTVHTPESTLQDKRNILQEKQAPVRITPSEMLQKTEKEVHEIRTTPLTKEQQAPDTPQTIMPLRFMPEKETKRQELLPKTPERSLSTPVTTPQQTASILLPARPPLQEFKPRQAPPKLVIGRITVEVIPPVAPAAKTVDRSVQKRSETPASAKTDGQQVYKLSFGLGQL